MTQARNASKEKTKVQKFRKQLKIAQNRLFRSWDIARTAPLDDNIHAILERKETHFRSMKKRLAGMEESLRALQEGIPEPVKVKPWKIERPTTESRLINYCEA